ncbi:MAG: YfhO family protein [Chloroflexota bacterium]|nr:YfhO family protein [Chloroflexota bacterium]MDQ5866017.1 YfhO family protein [Chloroflexota bacterium]
MKVGRLQFAATSVVEHETAEQAAPVRADLTAPARPSRLSRLAPHLAVLGLFTLLTIVATWPMFPQLGGFVMDKGDPLYSVWAMAWQAHALATQPLDLFNSNIMYPFRGTLTFDELSFAQAVLSAPFYFLLGNPVLSHNLILFLSFVLSGWATWLLVRELTGSSWGGIVAGAAFAFCFYRINHLPHITLDNTQWMPLVLLAAYKLLWTREWGWALALSGFFTLQALSGHYLAFYTAMLLGLFVVYYALAQRRVFSLSFLVKAGVGLAGSLVFILPIAIPYVRDQGQFEFSRSIFEAERFSNTLASFLAVFKGSPAYRSLLAPFADPGPWAIERAAFPGFFVLGLAITGLVLAFRGKANHVSSGEVKGSLRLHAGFYAIIAVISAVLSLGPSLQPWYAPSNYNPAAIQRVMPLPYLFLHEWVPGFQSMRVVTRIGIVTALALAVLAGMGALFLLRHLSARTNGHDIARRLVPVVAALVAFVPVAESWSAPISMQPVGTREAVPAVYKWLAEQPQTVILEYPMTHYKRGDPSVEMANLYQYYSVYHWHSTINGSTTIRPFSYSALVLETERCFPCPRSLGALRGLGVEYVVAHLENLSGPQREDFEWRSTAPEGKVVDDFELVQDFGPDRVYRLTGPDDAQELAGQLPEGASLLLANPEHDPAREGAETVYGGYMAAVAFYLRDHPQYGDPRLSFGQPIQPPEEGAASDFALLWTGEDPAQYGFSAEQSVWSNEFVTLYKRDNGGSTGSNAR